MNKNIDDLPSTGTKYRTTSIRLSESTKRMLRIICALDSCSSDTTMNRLLKEEIKLRNIEIDHDSD